MKTTTLFASISMVLLLNGCASMGKSDRIGKNDGSDRCFAFINRIDDTAIYYKDQRMTDIMTGAALGAGTGVLVGLAAGGNSTAMIAGGLTGALVGGFAADAYWKNKLRSANNQAGMAASMIETDARYDVERLTGIDNDIASLVRCRTEHRDFIKRQFAEGKITVAEAQKQWKEWGDLINKDREEMKYLSDSIINIKKIEDSYSFAANAIEDPSLITADMQKKWQQELQIEKGNQLAAAEQSYKTELATPRLTPKKKKVLKQEHQQKVAEINKTYAVKETEIKNKVNPGQSQLKQLVASIHEKKESVQKNKQEFDKLAVEAANDRGFEQITSKIPMMYQLAALEPVRYSGIW